MSRSSDDRLLSISVRGGVVVVCMWQSLSQRGFGQGSAMLNIAPLQSSSLLTKSRLHILTVLIEVYEDPRLFVEKHVGDVSIFKSVGGSSLCPHTLVAIRFVISLE